VLVVVTCAQNTQLQIFELATVTCPRYVLIIPDSWAKRIFAAASISTEEAARAAASLLSSIDATTAASFFSSWTTDTPDSGGWSSIESFCAMLLVRDNFRLYLLCESCGRIQRDENHDGYKITHVQKWIAKLQPALKVIAALAS
jgi:hypothetical protein